MKRILLLVSMVVLLLDPRAQCAPAAAAPVQIYPLPALVPDNNAPSAPDQPFDPRTTRLAAKLRQQALGPQPVIAPGGGPVLPVRVPGIASTTAAGETLHSRAENGTPSSLAGSVLERAFAGRTRAPGEREQRTAWNFLMARQGLMKIQDAGREWLLIRHETDALGMHHLRFRQVHRELPVWPCEASVHLSAAGDVIRLDGAYIPTPATVGIIPTIAADDALRRSRALVAGGSAAQATGPELIIYGPLERAPRLAWKIELVLGLQQHWIIVLDALTGAKLTAMNKCLHLEGMGVDSLGVPRPLEVSAANGGGYVLVDRSKPMYHADTDEGVIAIFDAENRSLAYSSTNDTNGELPVSVLAFSPDLNQWVAEAAGAAFNLSETYDYYRERHGRNSLDDAGLTLKALVRVGDMRNARTGGLLANAFWTGAPQNLMVFGNALAFASAIDVVGHELTHGVTEHTANLIYQNQPGALNEAMSDIFGEMIEARTAGTNDWLIGNALGQAVRSLADPKRFGQPARMKEFKTTTDDAGGVHLNSGIINRAYYLLAAGLPGAIGLRDAEQIFYRCLTHLQPQSRFIDARNGCVAAAEELFGTNSVQVLRVGQAFDAVDLFLAAPAPLPSLIPLTSGQDSLLFVYFDRTNGQFHLGRQEMLRGDGPTGVQLAPRVQRERRPAVSGDGSMAAFVTDESDLCFRRTDGGGRENCLDEKGLIHSVAVSRDGLKFAFVLLDETGYPLDSIGLYDVRTHKVKLYPLPFPALDGGGLGEIEFADSMTFSADGRLLIFDAYSLTDVGGEVAAGYGIYALDLKTGQVFAIAPPLAGFNVANPALHPVDNTLLAFEVHDEANNWSTVYIADLFFGDLYPVVTNYAYWAFPVFNGDGSALLFTDFDGSTDTGRSIYVQSLGADGVSADGPPTLWMSDAAIPVVYRRGRVTPLNTLPTVTLTAPRNGSFVGLPTNLVLKATASDRDGITRVEFFDGASRLGQALTNSRGVYSFNWTSPRLGARRLTARAMDRWGGTKDSAVTANIGDRPVILQAPVGQTTTAGTARVTFMATVTGSQPLKLQWRLNGAAIARATNATLVLTNLATRHAGKYQLYASSPYGKALTPPAVLSVLVRPKLTVQPRSQKVKLGRRLTLTSAATGTAPLNFQWFKGGDAIVGATKTTYVIPAVTNTDAATYSIEVSNAAGKATSTNAVVTVTP